MEALLILIAVLPVLIIATLVYIRDHNKEPLSLLIKLFTGGLFLSIMFTYISTSLLEKYVPFFGIETDKLNSFELVISVFIGIALIEELSKWLVAYFISYKHKEFDEFYDMIVYCVFVSLGFALIENIGYVTTEGLSTGIFRSLLSVPGHAFNGVFMGYYLGLAKISSKTNNLSLEKKNKIFSILIPIILHGIYDYCLLSNKPILHLAFLIYMVSLYVLAIKKINVISNIKEKI